MSPANDATHSLVLHTKEEEEEEEEDGSDVFWET